MRKDSSDEEDKPGALELIVPEHLQDKSKLKDEKQPTVLQQQMMDLLDSRDSSEQISFQIGGASQKPKASTVSGQRPPSKE